MLPSKRKKILSLALAGLVVVSSVAYLAFSGPKTGDIPPTLDLNFQDQGLQGLLQNQVSCRIPGYEFSDQDFTAPAEDKYRLTSGINIYHADQDITVKQVMDSIVPQEGNKVLLVTYNPINNPQKKFSLYPPVNSEDVISINSPENYTISSNNGIILVSCQPTDIYGIKPATAPGAGMPSNLADINDNWILAAASADLNLSEYELSAAWPQRDGGYSETTFPSSVDPNGELSLNNYYMVWLKVVGDKTYTFPDNITCTSEALRANPGKIQVARFTVAGNEDIFTDDFSWKWDFRDGKTVTQKREQVEHTYANAGTYVPKLTITHSPSSTTKTVTCNAVTVVRVPSQEVDEDYLREQLNDQLNDNTQQVKDAAGDALGNFDFGQNDFDPSDLLNNNNDSGVDLDFLREQFQNQQQSIIDNIGTPDLSVEEDVCSTVEWNIDPYNISQDYASLTRGAVYIVSLEASSEINTPFVVGVDPRYALIVNQDMADSLSVDFRNGTPYNRADIAEEAFSTSTRVDRGELFYLFIYGDAPLLAQDSVVMATTTGRTPACVTSLDISRSGGPEYNLPQYEFNSPFTR